MGFLHGKRALITGIISQRSIAWGIADAMHREGAQLAFTYVNDTLKNRVDEAANAFGSNIVLPCDVAQRRSDRGTVRRSRQALGRARHPRPFDRLRAARGAAGRIPRQPHARELQDRARHLELQPVGDGEGGAAADEGPRRLGAHADLSRRRSRDGELQRHGRWPRRASKRTCAISPTTSGRKARASTRFRPGRSRRSPPRASAISARCSSTSNRTRRCAAA